MIAVTGASATGNPMSSTTIGTSMSAASVSSTTTSTPAIATLASMPDPTDAQVVFWTSDGQTGASPPTASLSPFSAITSTYNAAANGSIGIYAGGSTSSTRNLALPSSQRWGGDRLASCYTHM